jgi:hypothetical protein
VTATATGFCCGFSVAKGWKGRQDSTKGLTQPIIFPVVAAAHSKYINSEPQRSSLAGNPRSCSDRTQKKMKTKTSAERDGSTTL